MEAATGKEVTTGGREALSVDERPWRTVLAASLLCLGGATAAIVLVRSFEFVPIPSFMSPYRPPEESLDRSSTSPVEPRTRGVTLILADGMRLDTSRLLPVYQRLREEGADVVTHAIFPSFTRVSTATILTGANPRDHGYLSNDNHRTSRLPSIGDLARRAGMESRHFSRGKGLVRVFPDAYESEADLDPDAMGHGPRVHFTFVYLDEPDDAAHLWGAASSEYVESAGRVGRAIDQIVSRSDLETETVILATDHGHLDRGGHGGHERVVLEVPLVLAGAGIRKGARVGPEASSDLRDIAATIVTLLGLPRESWMTGRPLGEVLAFAPDEKWVSEPASPPEGPLPWLRAGLSALFFLLPAALMARGIPPRRVARAMPVALLAAGAFYAAYALRGHAFSFSVLNHEREIPGFSLEVLVLASLPAVAVVLLSRRRREVLVATLAATAALAGALAGHAGFRAPAALGHPQSAFLAALSLAQLAATGLVTLAYGLTACLAGAVNASR